MGRSAGPKRGGASGLGRPRVYAAHPISCYGTAHAQNSREQLIGLLPSTEIVDPEALGWVTEEAWLDGWSALVPSLAGFVVFAAPDKTIGMGCVSELIDALFAGMPLAGLDGSGLRHLDGLRFLPEHRRTTRATARLLLGVQIDTERFPPHDLDGGKIGP
ncbi:MAG: hypothetical protein ACRDV4_02940 [Acidimicrobiales bacterium]